MTDCKTHYITKVVNVMKEKQREMLNEYLEYGDISNKRETFWTETKERFIDTDFLSDED
jgi:hypothetical protein